MRHHLVVRTTINLDDEMLERATNLTGITEKARLMNYILDKFVRSEAAKRLRKLSASMPDLDVPPRRSAKYSVSDDATFGNMVADDSPPYGSSHGKD